MTQYLLALYRDYAVPISPETRAKLAAAAEQLPIEVRPLFEGGLDNAIRATKEF